MAKRKEHKVNIDSYRRFVEENKLLQDILKKLQDKYEFPQDSLLEIGTGTGEYLTQYLIKQERAKNIDKFYAMEPVDEFFEEAKRHVVRLSRTDATAQQYFGGNPFDVITFAFVWNHIKPDQKGTFIENLYNNLSDEGKIVLVDTFIPAHNDENEKEQVIKDYLESHRDYHKVKKNEYPMSYYTNVVNEEHNDFWTGEYKTHVNEFLELLEENDFENINVELYKPDKKGDWPTMGYHIITAEKF